MIVSLRGGVALLHQRYGYSHFLLARWGVGDTLRDQRLLYLHFLLARGWGGGERCSAVACCCCRCCCVKKPCHAFLPDKGIKLFETVT